MLALLEHLIQGWLMQLFLFNLLAADPGLTTSRARWLVVLDPVTYFSFSTS